MRIAALYDIHGNLPALEAVLRALRQEEVDEIVVGGDVVPGPMPRQCVSALLDFPLPVRFIQGNGECDVLAAHRGDDLTRVPAAFHEVMRWVAGELPAHYIAFLAGWPRTLRREVPGLGEIEFCHATPRDDNELFTRETPEDRLRPIFEATGAAVVMCGHTHMQFRRFVGEVLVVNAGSVGMPFGEPGAHWALLGAGGVELRRTPYDLDAASALMGATHYPSDFDVRQPPSASTMLDAFEAAALR